MKRFFSAAGRSLVQPGRDHWLLAACALWLIVAASWRPLMLPDEGRYVGVAWEMLTSGNWLVPTLDGLPFFHKPPLFYWLAAASMKLFGAHAWAARMASTLPAIAALLAVHAFVRKYRDVSTANLTAVILTTQPFFFGAAQFANLDMLVAAMITLTIVCVADAAMRIDRQESGMRSLAAGYVFAALGMLAKGLIGWLLPAAVIGLWLILRGKFRLLFRLVTLPFMALTLLIAAPWFVAMHAKFPQFLDYFFLEQHFRRFTGTGFNNAQPFWFYLPVLQVLTLPWSPWVTQLLRWYRHWRGSDTDGLRRLMLVWPVVIIGFFSIPNSKLIGYVLPALAPIAFVLADSMKLWLDRVDTNRGLAWLGVSALSGLVLCAGLLGYLRAHDPSQLSKLAMSGTQGYQPGDQIVMLSQYPYDLPFYLRATTPAWVVDNWQSPAIQQTDNWRKEIADAGRFDPQGKQRQLISARELRVRLCAQRERTYWVWARRDAATTWPWLSAATLVFSNKKDALWRWQAHPDSLKALCDETPSSG